MNKTAQASRQQGGFSLLEVLVAFSILAASLGVLLPVFQGGLRSTSIARDYNHALILAEAKLAEIAVTDFLNQQSNEGDFDDRFRWYSAIDEYATAESPSAIGALRAAYSISVTVSWGDTPRTRSVVLTTLRLGNG